MCGIVGILGKQPVALSIVEALRRLEYRGYDSAGIATLENGGIERRRGRLIRAARTENLAAAFEIRHDHIAPVRVERCEFARAIVGRAPLPAIEHVGAGEHLHQCEV